MSQLQIDRFTFQTAVGDAVMYTERDPVALDLRVVISCGIDAYTAFWPACGCDGLYYLADFSGEELARELTPEYWEDLQPCTCHDQIDKLTIVANHIINWMRGYCAKLDQGQQHGA